MRIRLKAFLVATLFTFVVSHSLRADEIEMQNGDRYFGKVVSVSADAVVMDSQMLGKITVPRKKVTQLQFGTKAPAAAAVTNAPKISLPTKLPSASALPALTGTNVDLTAALNSLGNNTNFIQQIRSQLLGGNPAAARQYDAMVSELLSGKMNLNDLRQQAETAAAQIRELNKELGPDVSNSLDGYLKVLNQFLEESANAPAKPAVSPAPQAAVH